MKQKVNSAFAEGRVSMIGAADRSTTRLATYRCRLCTRTRRCRRASRSRSGPREWTGLVVVAATVIVIVPSWRWHLAASLLLAALTVVAVRSSGPAPLRALVFLDVIFVVFAGAAHVRWPPTVTALLVCLLPLAVLLVGNRGNRLGPSTPWLRVGRRPDRPAVVLAVSTVVVAGAALTLWTLVVTPAAPPYLAQLQRLPVWLAILGVIGFALVNPIWEEAMFRGVVLQDLSEIWGPRIAVVLRRCSSAPRTGPGIPPAGSAC
jgi:membrane protease YdiL (CAAX protease family)